MSVVANEKSLVTNNSTPTTIHQNTPINDGKILTVSVNSEEELLLTMQKIFEDEVDNEVDSVDFTDIVFGRTFDCFVDGVKTCKTIKKVILTASKLTEKEVNAIDILASDRKDVVLENSEGGFVGGVHTNWPLYYKTLYFEKAELQDIPELRRTPAEGIKIYKARYKRLPNKFIDMGAADGSNTLPLMLMGCENIDALDVDPEQKNKFNEKLEKFKLTKKAEVTNVIYHTCEFMNFQVSVPAEFLISNYVWSYRNPEKFDMCWKKSVDSVADNGFLCGEFFGKPSTPPREGITFHTFEEAISLLKQSNLEILYFEIEPHEVSLLERKDAETIPWGDLYRITVRKASEKIEEKEYEKVRKTLNQCESPKERRIFNVLESGCTQKTKFNPDFQ
ncbi:MAG: hypothetical protein AAGG81_02990 [Chlamydiota bacterium]